MLDTYYEREFQERHARNLRFLKRGVRLFFTPPVLLTVLYFGVWLNAQSSPFNSAQGLVYMVGAAWWLIVPAWLFLKAFHKAGETFGRGLASVKARKAVAVDKSSANGDSLSWIVQNYRTVLVGVGLTKQDAEGSATRQAVTSAAALNGRGRLVRAAGAAAMAADHLASRRIPVLLEVSPVDDYASTLLFEMLPGQTLARWSALHDELASGFRVPRVSVSQSIQERAQGQVEVTVYHRDALEDSADLNVQGWFE